MSTGKNILGFIVTAVLLALLALTADFGWYGSMAPTQAAVEADGSGSPADDRPPAAAPVVPAPVEDDETAPPEETVPDDVADAEQAAFGDETLSELRSERPNGDDFRAPYSQRELNVLEQRQIEYFRDNANDPEVLALARSFNLGDNADGNDLADAYVDHAELRAVGPDGLRVKNSYYVDGQIVKWETQVFPAGELVWFEEGTNKPLSKYVCGNRLWAVQPPERRRESTPEPASVPVAPVPAAPVVVQVIHVPEQPASTVPTAPEPLPNDDDTPDEQPSDTPDEDTSNDEDTPPSDDGDTPAEDEEPPVADECVEADMPAAMLGYEWVFNQETCEWDQVKLQDWQDEACTQNHSSDDCVDNETGQEPDENQNSGVDTDTTDGSTDGEPVNENSEHDGTAPAPDSSDNGSNSGHEDGTGTAHGSHGDDDGHSVNPDDHDSDPVSQDDISDDDHMVDEPQT